MYPTYDARGAVLKRHLPNDTCTYYSYDLAGRLASLADRRSDASVISSFAFSRDANGNILTSLREDSSCWYYQYDGLQRLTAAEWKDSGDVSLYAYEYDYDRVGNRTHLLYNGTHTYYTYNEANELLSEKTLGGDTAYYAYDGRGNQVQREVVGGDTTYFSYNSRDLITRIDSTEGGFTPNEFEYNALGQRIRITDSTGTTYFVWDGIRITHEHDGAGNITKRYTYGHSPIVGVSDLIDLQDLEAGGDPHYFYHFGPAGGIHRLTAADEATAQTLEFSPYGRMLVETGTAPNRFAFPATHWKLVSVPDVRLSPSRTLSAGVARFVTRDSGFARSQNRYVMVSNRPTGVADSNGYEPTSTNQEHTSYWSQEIAKLEVEQERWIRLKNERLGKLPPDYGHYRGEAGRSDPTLRYYQEKIGALTSVTGAAHDERRGQRALGSKRGSRFAGRTSWADLHRKCNGEPQTRRAVHTLGIDPDSGHYEGIRRSPDRLICSWYCDRRLRSGRARRAPAVP